MRVTSIEITSLVHATEDFEKVLGCLRNLIPFEFKYSRVQSRGHFGNPINILRVVLNKRREIALFLESLLHGLSSEDKEVLCREVEERLEEGGFYLRLDKFKAYSGIASLGRGIQVAITVTSYPFERKRIIAGLRELLACAS